MARRFPISLPLVRVSLPGSDEWVHERSSMPELLESPPASFSRKQYRALLDVAEAIAVHRDLGELFHDLADRLPRIVPFDFINLVLHDPARDVMRLHLLVSPQPNTLRPGMEVSMAESPAA